jgi:DNA-binding transcriptional LysR family regulator
VHSDYGSTDIVQAGLDFSIRISARPPDSSLYCKTIASVPQITVAAPTYLEQRGAPSHPEELTRHNCLIHLLSAPNDIWRYTSESRECAVKVDGSIKSELGEALRSAALMGKGISMHPAFMLAEDLRTGRLLPLMQPWRAPEMHVLAVYASNQHQPNRVRAFVNFLRKWFYASSRGNFPVSGAAQTNIYSSI